MKVLISPVNNVLVAFFTVTVYICWQKSNKILKTFFFYEQTPVVYFVMIYNWSLYYSYANTYSAYYYYY